MIDHFKCLLFFIYLFYILSFTEALPSVSRLREVEIQRDSVTLAWEPPRVPSGRPLKGYLIESREVSPEKEEEPASWSRVSYVPPTTKKYTVPDLKSDRDYTFRIFAEHLEGLSQPQELTRPVRPKTDYESMYQT